jgi:hypothetical protein
MAAGLAMGACSPTTSEGVGGSMLRSIFYGGSVPPSGPGLGGEIECPPVTIMAGGAAINSYSGGRAGSPESLRSQLSIAEVARECFARADGSLGVKVGVEVRALVGPGGGAGRFEAPVRFVIKRGERVLASASRRGSVALSSGQMHGSITVVEEGLVIPAGTGDFDIEVCLGGSGTAEPSARRARR